MNLSECDVQDVGLNELTECLQWLLTKMRVERAQWVMAQLMDRVEQQRSKDIFAVAARQNGQIVAAALALTQPPGAATLVAMAAGDGAPDDPSAVQLAAVLTRLCARLRANGLRFLQASAEEPDDARQLERLGFTHLADLAFLVLDRAQFPAQRTTPSQKCRFEIVGAESARIAAACELAAQTFAGTQDCPRLSQFRTAAEIVESYGLSRGFDPQLWRLMLCDHVPIGCLFLTQHRARTTSEAPPGDEERGAIEISYMGLLPEHRGQGLGRYILSEATQIATLLGAPRMVLAVDRANLPANALYHRRGWIEAGQESVWGMAISP